MMANVYHGILVLFAIGLQTAFLPRLNLIVLPNIPLILTGIFALFRGTKSGLGWGLLNGFLIDLSAFGTNILTLPLVGLALGSLEGKFYKSNYLFPPLALFTVSLLNGMLTYFISEDLLFNLPFLTSMQKIILPGAFLDSLFGGILYAILFYLECIISKEFRDDSYASTGII